MLDQHEQAARSCTTSFAVNAVPGARLVVYTPDDEPSRKAIARLAAGD